MWECLFSSLTFGRGDMFPGGSLGVAEDAGGSPNEEYEEKLEVREFFWRKAEHISR